MQIDSYFGTSGIVRLKKSGNNTPRRLVLSSEYRFFLSIVATSVFAAVIIIMNQATIRLPMHHVLRNSLWIISSIKRFFSKKKSAHPTLTETRVVFRCYTVHMTGHRHKYLQKKANRGRHRAKKRKMRTTVLSPYPFEK